MRADPGLGARLRDGVVPREAPRLVLVVRVRVVVVVRDARELAPVLVRLLPVVRVGARGVVAPPVRVPRVVVLLRLRLLLVVLGPMLLLLVRVAAAVRVRPLVPPGPPPVVLPLRRLLRRRRRRRRRRRWRRLEI